MISILKCLRDGQVTNLEEAFSPDSQYILFPRDGVSKHIKKSSAVTEALASLSFLRITEKHGKNEITPTDQRNHYLNPDSDKPPIDSDEYKGEDFIYG